MTVGEWALREGFVLDAIARHDPADWSDDPRGMRKASVLSLCRRCQWDEEHGRQVARLAVDLFDQTRTLHGMGPDDRELLHHAALLHDIGEHVVSRGPPQAHRLPHPERQAPGLRARRGLDARLDRPVPSAQ